MEQMTFVLLSQTSKQIQFRRHVEPSKNHNSNASFEVRRLEHLFKVEENNFVF
jgi:hypothetical protein